MRTTRWIVVCVLGAFLLTGSLARAQGHGNGHGKGHGKHGDDDDQGEYYKDRDREAIRGWYKRTREQPSARTCQERPVAPWIGKTTCAARHAPTWTPEKPPALSSGS